MDRRRESRHGLAEEVEEAPLRDMIAFSPEITEAIAHEVQVVDVGRRSWATVRGLAAASRPQSATLNVNEPSELWMRVHGTTIVDAPADAGEHTPPRPGGRPEGAWN